MSEFRQDPVSGDWVIMAPERAKRPQEFLPPKRTRKPTPKQACPFENLEKTDNWPPIFMDPKDLKKWQVAVISNKYPALHHAHECGDLLASGPYHFREGIGYHDLVITRDHRKNIADLSRTEAVRTFTALQNRFHTIAKDPCMVYTSAFFNWGPTAGASLYHPHYQVLSLPIIPPAVEQSLKFSRVYFEKHRRCVHCEVLRFERRHKNRIIEENGTAIAVTPYAPRGRFEVSVYPKRHVSSFEKTSVRDLTGVASALQSVMKRIRKHLHDPDLNFFIHTSPLRDGKKYAHYHWHIDVIPKISIPAGFELSTGMDINMIDPDWLAALLKGKALKRT